MVLFVCLKNKNKKKPSDILTKFNLKALGTLA